MLATGVPHVEYKRAFIYRENPLFNSLGFNTQDRQVHKQESFWFCCLTPCMLAIELDVNSQS